MPSIKHKAHRPRRAKSPGRVRRSRSRHRISGTEESCFAHVEQAVEPDAYITDLHGDILFAREDDDEIPVGTISAHSVHLDKAAEDGVSWFDVSDARSGDTAVYIDLIDAEESGYSEWIESEFEPFGSGLLILDRIRIEPEHRGHGYGLYAAELMITGFASGRHCRLCASAI